MSRALCSAIDFHLSLIASDPEMSPTAAFDNTPIFFLLFQNPVALRARLALRQSAKGHDTTLGKDARYHAMETS